MACQSYFDVNYGAPTFLDYKVTKRVQMAQFVYHYRPNEEFERVKAQDIADAGVVFLKSKPVRCDTTVSAVCENVLKPVNEVPRELDSDDETTVVVKPRTPATKTASTSPYTMAPTSAGITLAKVQEMRAKLDRLQQEKRSQELKLMRQEVRFLEKEATLQSDIESAKATLVETEQGDQEALQPLRDELTTYELRIGDQKRRFDQECDSLEEKVTELRRVNEAMDSFLTKRSKTSR